MKSLGIMRGESHFRLIFGRCFGSLVSSDISSERGCSWNIHFTKVFNFEAFVSSLRGGGQKGNLI